MAEKTRRTGCKKSRLEQIKKQLSMSKTIAFQGTFGAYSHLASKEIFPDAKFLPCTNFAQAFDTVQTNIAIYKKYSNLNNCLYCKNTLF